MSEVEDLLVFAVGVLEAQGSIRIEKDVYPEGVLTGIIRARKHQGFH